MKEAVGFVNDKFVKPGKTFLEDLMGVEDVEKHSGDEKREEEKRAEAARSSAGGKK
jgi:hypothetical protein